MQAPRFVSFIVDLTINGGELLGNGRVWRMTGNGLDSATGLARNDVQVMESPLSEVPKAMHTASISIAIYEFERRQGVR